jgi:hypothetical protein
MLSRPPSTVPPLRQHDFRVGNRRGSFRDERIVAVWHESSYTFTAFLARL